MGKNQEVTDASAELSLLQGQALIKLGAGASGRTALERTLALMEEAPAWNLELTREEIERLVSGAPE